MVMTKLAYDEAKEKDIKKYNLIELIKDYLVDTLVAGTIGFYDWLELMEMETSINIDDVKKIEEHIELISDLFRDEQ